MSAKVCCDQCGIDVDIRYQNMIYCGKCYAALAHQIDDLGYPTTTCQNCNRDVTVTYNDVCCEDCYIDLKQENKELKEELSRLQKIVK